GGAQLLAVSRRVAGGMLTLAGTAGLIGGDFDGRDGILGLIGTQDAINTALAKGFTYTPRENFFGSDALTIRVYDQGHGTSAPLSDTETVDITVVEDPNEAPSINLGGVADVTTDEDEPFVLNTIRVSDPDIGDQDLRVSLSVAGGTLTLGDAPTGSIDGLSGDLDGSDGVLGLVGTQAAINAALASGLKYTPRADFFGSDALTIRV